MTRDEYRESFYKMIAGLPNKQGGVFSSCTANEVIDMIQQGRDDLYKYLQSYGVSDHFAGAIAYKTCELCYIYDAICQGDLYKCIDAYMSHDALVTWMKMRESDQCIRISMYSGKSEFMNPDDHSFKYEVFGRYELDDMDISNDFRLYPDPNFTKLALYYKIQRRDESYHKI